LLRPDFAAGEQGTGMPAVLLVYLGLLVIVLGVVLLIKPLTFLGIRSRCRGALVLVVGLVFLVVGLALPAQETRVATAQTQLDQFAPVYQFHEVHSIQVHAPKDRVYQAIKAVTADDVLFFRTLTWMRRFGMHAPEGILNPPPAVPILEVATRTAFLLLAEEPGREIVLGTVVVVPRGWRPRSHATPEDFKAVAAPGFALATMNFLVQEVGPDACMVTTETRVYATDSGARRKFAGYWRVIYPGSAFIRRMWLRAIRLRAEKATN
jgi:hypothetical protein